MAEPLIRNVSDTARWVAAYRARESARTDALFRDPLAGKLAGERGQAIADKMNRVNAMGDGWPIISRTKIIDDFIAGAIREGCDCVLNLAAGLDTRPYRLDLPKDFVWVEADLPEILQYKELTLAEEKPVCRLRREAIDLSDAEARARLLDDVAKSHEFVVVICEGLLIYLDPDAVTALSGDIAGRMSLRYWITDIASPGILERMQKGQQLIEAPMNFGPANGVAFFEAMGWKVRDHRSLFKEGSRLKRVPWFMRPFSLLPEPNPRKPGNAPWSWVVLWER